MPSPEETALNKIRKLESNKHCANCDGYSKFGHQNVTEKFKTFVCSMCKSAHQSFSMRVKSVSMSNWTMAEVKALEKKNGGGNDAARDVWFATWSPKKLKKPTSDDKLDYYKHFVKVVFLEEAFRCDAQDEDDHEDEEEFSEEEVVERKPRNTGRATPSPATDLLDFSSAETTVVDEDAGTCFFTDSPRSKANGDFDPFGMGDMAQNLPPQTNTPSPPANSQSSWDPFGMSDGALSPPAQSKQPILTPTITPPSSNAPAYNANSAPVDPFMGMTSANVMSAPSSLGSMPAAPPAFQTSASDPFASMPSAAPTFLPAASSSSAGMSSDPFAFVDQAPTVSPIQSRTNSPVQGRPPMPMGSHDPFASLGKANEMISHSSQRAPVNQTCRAQAPKMMSLTQYQGTVQVGMHPTPQQMPMPGNTMSQSSGFMQNSGARISAMDMMARGPQQTHFPPPQQHQNRRQHNYDPFAGLQG